jgi:hypothetical protein
MEVIHLAASINKQKLSDTNILLTRSQIIITLGNNSPDKTQAHI